MELESYVYTRCVVCKNVTDIAHHSLPRAEPVWCPCCLESRAREEERERERIEADIIRSELAHMDAWVMEQMARFDADEWIVNFGH